MKRQRGGQVYNTAYHYTLATVGGRGQQMRKTLIGVTMVTAQCCSYI